MRLALMTIVNSNKLMILNEVRLNKLPANAPQYCVIKDIGLSWIMVPNDLGCTPLPLEVILEYKDTVRKTPT